MRAELVHIATLDGSKPGIDAFRHDCELAARSRKLLVEDSRRETRYRDDPSRSPDRELSRQPEDPTRPQREPRWKGQRDDIVHGADGGNPGKVGIQIEGRVEEIGSEASEETRQPCLLGQRSHGRRGRHQGQFCSIFQSLQREATVESGRIVEHPPLIPALESEQRLQKMVCIAANPRI